MLTAGGGTHIANCLVGGQVNSGMLVLSTAMPFLMDGKIRALWISDTVRVPQLPHIKRIGMAMPLWQRLFMKAGPPAARVTAVDKALQESLAKPELRQKLHDAGSSVAPMHGPEFKAFIKPHAALYRDIVTSSKITME
ncbi:tripartite tricarboxylate transporter substrate-binding protein [Acidovorax sp. LjRoot118]|uniref:tripartite tricarboxylate transporter substrate-binding protein n=1 Tax=Acidovorax sp. LjRoot118 TaxID=3342256 RepID=UPI003ECDFF71